MSVAQKNRSASVPPVGEPQAGARRATLRDSALVAVAVLLLLAPFLAKPLHIDDPLFVWCAKHIQRDPLDFYGFTINWYGYDELMYMVTQNPPLACYWLAAAGSLFGWREVVLHAAMLGPAVMAAVGAYFLARRACDRPLLAALIGVATPAFVVSSSTLMCDVMMLAFWCWAVVAWVKGCDERRVRWLYVSAVLAILAALTKYYAVCLIPLLAAYVMYRRYEPRFVPAARGRTTAPTGPGVIHVVAALLVIVAGLAAYDVATRWWYGIPLLSRAMFYAAEKSPAQRDYARQILVGLSMLGGCMPVALFYVYRLWSWIAGMALAAVFVVLTAAFAAGGAMTGLLGDSLALPAGVIAPQFVAFVLAGVLVVALAVFDFWRCRDSLSLLLLLWLLGTYAFAGFVNWTTNARSVLPAAPVVGILIVRQLEARAAARRSERRKGSAATTKAGSAGAAAAWADYVPLVPAAALALLVAWADMQAAKTARHAAETLAAKYSNPPLMWYQGHWGFQYYMDEQPLPANHFNLRSTPLRAGDRLVIPENNTNTFLTPPLLAQLELVTIEKKPTGTLASTVWEGTAGLYSSAMGPLPYVLGSTGPEEYYVYRALRDIPIAVGDKDNSRRPPDSPALRKYQRLHEGYAPGAPAPAPQ